MKTTKRIFLLALLAGWFGLGFAQETTYKIGDLIAFPDKSYGVVFYLDERTGDGLAVSMDEIKAQWQAADEDDDCVNIYKLMDKGGYGEFCIPGSGLEQTNLILEQLGPQFAPAAGWCRMHGEEWYLPSASELYYMLVVANESGGDSGPLSTMIKKNGGQTIEYRYYWSSCEEDTEHAFNVCTVPRKKKSSEGKEEEEGVRAVRHFTFK